MLARWTALVLLTVLVSRVPCNCTGTCFSLYVHLANWFKCVALPLPVVSSGSCNAVTSIGIYSLPSYWLAYISIIGWHVLSFTGAASQPSCLPAASPAVASPPGTSDYVCLSHWFVSLLFSQDVTATKAVAGAFLFLYRRTSPFSLSIRVMGGAENPNERVYPYRFQSWMSFNLPWTCHVFIQHPSPRRRAGI
jgi:hypothetical protein